jgi:uncharacterized membrane protein YsdA (DUF1294 family)
MMIRLLLSLLCLASVAAQAEAGDIVKCVQRDGSVLYTDQPCERGETVEVVLKPLPIVGAAEETPGVHSFDQKFALPEISLPAVSVLNILGLYLLMSVMCFGVYWVDKRSAIKDERRVPENTLHLLELLGGWPGGFVAQRVLRHKNRKSSYQVAFWCIVVLHVAVWVWVFLQNG